MFSTPENPQNSRARQGSHDTSVETVGRDATTKGADAPPRAPAREKTSGRPRVSDANRRDAQLHVRLTLSEWDDVASKADAAGLPIAAFARSTLLNTRIAPRIHVPAATHEARAELVSIGRNLNQIAKAFHLSRKAGEPEFLSNELQDLLDRLSLQVKELAFGLMSGAVQDRKEDNHDCQID